MPSTFPSLRDDLMRRERCWGSRTLCVPAAGRVVVDIGSAVCAVVVVVVDAERALNVEQDAVATRRKARKKEEKIRRKAEEAKL